MMDKRAKIAAPANNTLTSCVRCGTNHNVKRFKRLDNAGWKVMDWCCWCGQVADPSRPFIPKIQVTNFRDLEIFPEFPLDVPRAKNVCCVCGSIENIEKHHWAPFKVFGEEADLWPVSYLCHECHMLWHRKMPNGMDFIESHL